MREDRFDTDLGVHIRDGWRARERVVARRLALTVFRREYRNLAVIKRLACLRAARAILDTLEGGDL